jgi:uncharacterized protein YebE (UPF0316 family)
MQTALAMIATVVLAMLSVSLWTLRVALTARNHKAFASVVAALEATVFALAFSRLLANLDCTAQVLAYAAGVGAGTLAGLSMHDRLVRPRPRRARRPDWAG